MSARTICGLNKDSLGLLHAQHHGNVFCKSCSYLYIKSPFLNQTAVFDISEQEENVATRFFLKFDFLKTKFYFLLLWLLLVKTDLPLLLHICTFVLFLLKFCCFFYQTFSKQPISNRNHLSYDLSLLPWKTTAFFWWSLLKTFPKELQQLCRDSFH